MGPKPMAPPPPATASPMTWAPLHNKLQHTVDRPRKTLYLGIPNKHNLLVRTRGCLVIQQRHGSSCALSRTVRVVGQGGWVVDRHRRHGLSALLLDLGYESADDAWARRLCGSSGSDDVHGCTWRRRCRNSANRDCGSNHYECCKRRREHPSFGVLSSVPSSTIYAYARLF